MATLGIELSVSERSSERTREHLFFAGMSGLIALIFFIGFARTYYLAAVFDAKPLPALVHVHAAVFTSWIVLLVVQTLLVGTGHRSVHRRLGIVGIGLAPLVVLLGVLVAMEMLVRFAAVPRVDSALIFGVALSEIAGFAVPVFFALRLRRRPDDHKRLIMIGTIAMTTAGFGRWPVSFLLHKPLPAMLCAFALLGMMMAFDVLSLRRVHPMTIRGSAWVVFIEVTAAVAGRSAVWHTFANHVRALVS